MSVSYCTLEDVKSSLSGDVPNMGSNHDQSLVNKIVEVSRDIDRKVAECRGDSISLFSFLVERLYSRQRVYLSSTPRATDGSFLLSFDGQITGPIAYDAPASTVQSELENLSTVGSGNAVVSGFPGGPWTVDFAGTLVGYQPTIEGQASVTPSDATIVVLPMIDGVPVLAAERFFRPTPALYGHTLVIDDCLEILTVRGLDASGSEIAIPDWHEYPLRGTPIEGLKGDDDWPEYPSRIGVSARWGHSATIPADVREAASIEAVRSHLAAIAGNDDRIGVTPFGKVMTSKAFTSKTHDLVQTYGHTKLW